MTGLLVRSGIAPNTISQPYAIGYAAPYGVSFGTTEANLFYGIPLYIGSDSDTGGNYLVVPSDGAGSVTLSLSGWVQRASGHDPVITISVWRVTLDGSGGFVSRSFVVGWKHGGNADNTYMAFACTKTDKTPTPSGVGSSNAYYMATVQTDTGTLTQMYANLEGLRLHR